MLQNTQLLTNSTTRNSHPTTFDAKSETSTEPDENPQSHFLFTHDFPSKHSPSSKIKTSLCRNYIEKAFCPYGDKCQFAHGPEELKINMEYNKSYKTKVCHAFNQMGYCHYGNRCNFIHEKNVGLCPLMSKKLKIYQNFGAEICQIQYKEQSSILRMLKQSQRI